MGHRIIVSTSVVCYLECMWEQIQKRADAVIAVGLYAILLMPLVVWNGFVYPFVTAKAIWSMIMIGVVLVAVSLGTRLRHGVVQLGVIPSALLMLLGVLSLSALLNEHTTRSIFGEAEHSEGVVFFATCILVYFVYRYLTDDRVWRRISMISLLVLCVVVWIAALQTQGVVGGAVNSERIDALFGNANYLAHYLLLMFFVSLLVWVRSLKRPARWVAMLLAVVVSGTLFYTGSRGALIALVGGSVVGGVLVLASRFRQRNMSTRMIGVMAVILVCVVLVIESGALSSLPTVERFKETSYDLTEQPRYYIWDAALKGGMEHPIVGYGLESFGGVHDRFVSPASLRDPLFKSAELWSDRVHNSLLEIFVAAGVVGVIAYLLVWVSAIYTAWRVPELYERAICIALIVSHLIFTLFSFDTPVSLVSLAIILAYISYRAEDTFVLSKTLSKFQMNTMRVLLCAVGIVLVGIAFVRVHDAWIVRNVLDTQPDGTPERAYALADVFERSLIDKNTPLEMFPVAAIKSERSLLPDQRAELLGEVDVVYERARKASLFEPKMEYYFAQLYRQAGRTTQAIEILEPLHALAPHKQAFAFELARAYRDEGSYDAAERVLKTTYESEPTYDQAFNEYASILYYLDRGDEADIMLLDRYGTTLIAAESLVIAYKDTGRLSNAVKILEKVVSVSPHDIKYRILLTQAYLAHDRLGDAQDLLLQGVQYDKEHREFYQYCSAYLEQHREMCAF